MVIDSKKKNKNIYYNFLVIYLCKKIIYKLIFLFTLKIFLKNKYNNN